MKLSFDVVYGKQMTLYHVHDGDFEIRPNEPKLMIGVHFFWKKTQKQEKNNLFSTISEAVDYVIITHLLSCKICIVLQDSCKTGVLVYHLARFALSDICSKKFFFQESCKISCKICILLKNLARFEFRSTILQDSHQMQDIGKNL